jgi:exopolyphosphatase / guanosine-5'-triphosphate,3'-diphosphate pyrophosphatase
VRRACIDIGSNTTRLLVADHDGAGLEPVHQERAFTHICRGRLDDGTITHVKIDEVVSVVVAQLRRARELGARDVRAIATATVRHAPNGPELVAAVRERCGLDVEVLSGEREARLAFVGAARTLDHVPEGELGVIDVGGGSSELVVGIAPDNVSWSASFAVGSGELTERRLVSDPPSESELDEARAEIGHALRGLEAPTPAEAVAVGGSASSLRRLVGPALDSEAFTRALALIVAEPARELARVLDLDIERVRLMPAGLLILQAAAELFAAPLSVGLGGIREGLLLEAYGV